MFIESEHTPTKVGGRILSILQRKHVKPANDGASHLGLVGAVLRCNFCKRI